MARFAIVALLAVASFGCSKSAVLTDPPVISSTVMADPTFVRAAVLQAATRRRWVAERDDPGVVLARFVHGGHHVRVWIRYDASNVAIQYADSQNMAFRLRNGVPYIHKAYNKWVTVLSRDIYRLLACGPSCIRGVPGAVMVVPGQPTPVQPMPGPEPIAPGPAPAPGAPAPAPAPYQPTTQPSPIVYE